MKKDILKTTDAAQQEIGSAIANVIEKNKAIRTDITSKNVVVVPFANGKIASLTFTIFDEVEKDKKEVVMLFHKFPIFEGESKWQHIVSSGTTSVEGIKELVNDHQLIGDILKALNK